MGGVPEGGTWLWPHSLGTTDPPFIALHRVKLCPSKAWKHCAKSHQLLPALCCCLGGITQASCCILGALSLPALCVIGKGSWEKLRVGQEEFLWSKIPTQKIIQETGSEEKHTFSRFQNQCCFPVLGVSLFLLMGAQCKRQ